MFPAAIVKGQTNTTDSHERLVSIGVTPRVKADASPDDVFPFVVFSAPPSGSDDYAAEVKAALDLWDGTGGFVFTSSTAVYAGTDGEPCDESTPEFKIGENPRADRLLEAEAAVLAANGCVVRLSGLYHSTRGAHMYFLKGPTLNSSADGLVNLVHYEDAAAAVVDTLKAQLDGVTEGGEVFLATDGVPITRKDMVEACLVCPAYEGGSMPEFTAESDASGKSMTNPLTREKLGWEPVHASFAEFVAAGAMDSFSNKKIKFK
jgi:nucleoside-diphosphate-sugar epimerase